MESIQQGVMQYKDFIGHVHDKAELATTGAAVKAVRATLQTLGERLHGNEANSLAAQLPEEIGTYLRMANAKGSFSVDEFLRQVAAREDADLPDATYHARVVMEVLQEAVAPGEIDDILAQLPDEYSPLFEAGSKDEMTIS